MLAWEVMADRMSLYFNIIIFHPNRLKTNRNERKSSQRVQRFPMPVVIPETQYEIIYSLCFSMALSVRSFSSKALSPIPHVQITLLLIVIMRETWFLPTIPTFTLYDVDIRKQCFGLCVS